MTESSAKSELLLVDDDPGSLMVLTKVLDAEYEIRFATSGLQALELMATFVPDLILLDMVMPQMNGIETLERIRANPATHDIPVLFVTATHDAESESMALRCGADDFIHKPINRDVLLARVAVHLEKQRMRRLTEQQRDELVASTRALTTALKELDAFAYSVSHDLRTPLRGIDGFSSILLRKYAGQLDEQGQEMLRRTRAATQRMGHMIDDMLTLSRISRAELSAQEFDMSALVADAVKQLNEAFADRVVEMNIQPDVRAYGDPKLVRIVLDNLLGNAWKFTAKTEHAKVEFGCQMHDGEAEYFVKDNGAGFDMAYADKLFGAFQRLHSTNEFPGTGIGLATVMRVVRKHGGNIRAQSEPGMGATFAFTLPAQGVNA